MSDVETDRLFRIGRYSEATARLKKGLLSQGENGRDSLLYLLDLGLSLHTGAEYEESNQVFLKADRLAEIKDYTSLSTEGATLLTSENIKDYSAEDFENVLVSTYLAMNFALLGDTENALVEARRVNSKLYRMVNEGKRKYKQSAFARYLSAILYEAQGDYSDAYVDYKNVWKLIPAFPGLGRELWRCAWLLKMPDEMERWDVEFHLRSEDHLLAKKSARNSGFGELIILYENGISPRKYPHPHFRSLPRFYPRLNPVSEAQIEINGEVKGVTAVLDSIESTAIANLDEKYAGLIAKKIAGMVAKETVAYGVERQTKSPVLGLIVKTLFYVSDQADLRSWNLLPKDLQIFRIVVTPGVYKVRALPVGAAPLPETVLQVEAGQKKFLNFRYMP